MKNAATVVGACVVLHNIFETFGDHCLEYLEHVDDINTEYDNNNATHGRQSCGHSAVYSYPYCISQFLNNTNFQQH